MKKLVQILCLSLFIFYLLNNQNVYAGKRTGTTINAGIFAAQVSPGSDDFRFHSKNGMGGGIIVTTAPTGNIMPVGFLLISSFAEKSHGEFDFFTSETTEKNTIISSGLGFRVGSLASSLKIFGEAYLTFNLVNFDSYMNYDKPREVGYIGTKIGFAFGAGIGFKNLAVGYRRINAGGGNISYSALFAEFVVPIINK